MQAKAKHDDTCNFHSEAIITRTPPVKAGGISGVKCTAWMQCKVFCNNGKGCQVINTGGNGE